MINLRIDTEFRDKLPPLTDSEFEQLRENILSDGKVNRPLIAWHGALEAGEEEHDYLIDGHNRWRVIEENPEIPYTVEFREFPNKWAAIAWMYRNQKGQRNLSELWQEKINAEIVKAETKAVGEHTGNQYTRKMELDEVHTIPNGTKPKSTIERVSKEIGVPAGTLRDQVALIRGLDAADEVSPGFQDKVLNGELKPTKRDVRTLRLMEPEERKEAVAKLESGKRLKEPVSMESMNATPLPEQEYTEDDFRNDIMDIPKELDDLIRLFLLAHRDMLENEYCKHAYTDMLMNVCMVAEKYRKEIDT